MRKQLRLENYDYSSPGAYFVTFCCRGRKSIFGELKNYEICLNEFGKIVRQEWLSLENVFPGVQVDEYVVMPNHFHGILIFNEYIVGAIHVTA